ncbi:tRNA epoxyqueuosine(34) reductase QueG [Rhabdothermincola salaria]|uniref:tRNA epoxyqueuosine(34) reductase QueG n=1 Tax=Rhabdothermincola salaria TaxID=2903142 RepID=UPI001E4C70E5|nr:tRNA epoxyqueuosine(34) reductase QueG [Rhabdothermincola salaria]MCD9622437.1 tRNA epoxyqueuosine(34) reductase QueG [Rhabdothermincola salaria]
MSVPTLQALRDVGVANGLVAVGVTDAGPLVEARAAIEERRRVGLHGGMQFTYRNPARSTEPARILDGARSLVVGAHPYAGGPVDHGGTDGPRLRGRVARYATDDHYGALRAALSEMAGVLERAGWRARVVADDNALVDRAAAQRAGVGWFGRNANILVPGHGSWVVLGAVVTDAELGTSEAVPDGCGSCRRCLDGCPTGAIVAPGVVDARRCLAWLVQADGPFPEEHRVALGDRIYGCDDCQEVCPPSRRSPEGRAEVASSGAWVDLLEMLESSDEHLLDTHGRWYIPRRDPRYLRRNALVALGNVAEPGHAEVAAVLERYAAGDDELLAEHARWARGRVQERASA